MEGGDVCVLSVRINLERPGPDFFVSIKFSWTLWIKGNKTNLSEDKECHDKRGTKGIKTAQQIFG